MKNVFKNHVNFLIMIIIALAMAIFSCSSDSDDTPPSPVLSTVSSSSGGIETRDNSSSSVAAIAHCGSVEYDPSNAKLRCNESVLEAKCGTVEPEWYNKATDFCQGSLDGWSVKPLCGENRGYVSNEFCQDGTVKLLCGGQAYTTSQFCCNNVVGNAASQFCCGGSIGSNANQRCIGNSVVTLPSTPSTPPAPSWSCVNPSSYGSFGTVTIGTQVWMKENLKSCGGTCYNKDPANCAKYGPLYDWAAAMALPANCNSETCASLVAAKHRGLCPAGWHIPSDAEWSALMTAVGGESTAGKKLKAADGWNSGSNGDDTYGFAALPGGHGNSGGSFNYVGNSGYWWSASENGSYGAYLRFMRYYNESALWINYGKYGLFSVRCVKD